MKITKYLAVVFVVACTIQETILAENPKIDYVELTDSSTHAGTRKSKATLKCVEKKTESGNAIDISLNAFASISNSDGSQPSWTSSTGTISGNGSNAIWTGRESTNISASLSGHSASANLELSNPKLPTIEIKYETSGLKPAVDKITDWLTRYYETPTFTFGGQLSFVPTRCDYYNDGSKLGYKVDASASLSVSLPTFNPKTPPLPTGIPGLTLTGKLNIDTLKIEAGLGGSYNQELANPWANPIKGTITGSTGVKVALVAQAGPDVANVQLSASISTKIECSGTIQRNNNDIRLEAAMISIGELKGDINVSASVKIGLDWKIQFDLVSKKFSDAADFSIDAPKVLYKIPS